jgi:mono/diheme cytochrome c family protein
MHRSLAILLVFIAAFFIIADGLSAKKPKARPESDEVQGPAARLSEAPESARALKDPYEGDPNSVSAGRKLYLLHCAECHGREGYGIGRAANMHSKQFQAAPPGVLYWAIRNGRLAKGMPSWSGLPDQQRWQLVTYLKTLR